MIGIIRFSIFRNLCTSIAHMNIHSINLCPDMGMLCDFRRKDCEFALLRAIVNNSTAASPKKRGTRLIGHVINATRHRSFLTMYYDTFWDVKMAIVIYFFIKRQKCEVRRGAFTPHHECDCSASRSLWREAHARETKWVPSGTTSC